MTRDELYEEFTISSPYNAKYVYDKIFSYRIKFTSLLQEYAQNFGDLCQIIVDHGEKQRDNIKDDISKLSENIKAGYDKERLKYVNGVLKENKKNSHSVSNKSKISTSKINKGKIDKSKSTEETLIIIEEGDASVHTKDQLSILVEDLITESASPSSKPHNDEQKGCADRQQDDISGIDEFIKEIEESLGTI